MRLLGLTKNRLFIAKLVGQLFAGKQWGYNNTNNNHFAFLLPYTAVPLVFAMGVGKGISLRDGYGRNADNITLNGFTAVSSPTDAYPIGWLSLGF